SVPSSATRKFRPPVPTSAPTSSAQQCTHLCHSAVSHTCAQKCHLPVPRSATYLCPPVPPTCARPPVPPTSAAQQCCHQCRQSVPSISTHHQC
ncbi:unnamed protein product, partial [Staurois parvus]